VAPNLFLLSELRACSAIKFVIAKDLQVKFVFLKGLGTEICPISGALRRFGPEVIDFRIVAGKFVQIKDLSSESDQPMPVSGLICIPDLRLAIRRG
jgi:hypothetical protein